MALVDDSEAHRGHGGYNPAGESHFTLTIESAVFAGKSRVERQRLVYAALGELMDERVHALSRREPRRAELVDEDERADHRPLARRKGSPNLECAKVMGDRRDRLHHRTVKLGHYFLLVPWPGWTAHARALS